MVVVVSERRQQTHGSGNADNFLALSLDLCGTPVSAILGKPSSIQNAFGTAVVLGTSPKCYSRISNKPRVRNF